MAALPTGRRLKWLVVAVWLVIGVAVSPLAFMLSDAQTNDAAAFLPADAESTRLLEAQRKLPGGDAIVAAVVLARDEGLTEQDLAAAERLGRRLEPFSATTPLLSVPAPDGRAVLISIPMPQTSDAHQFTGDVEEMRQIVAEEVRDLPGLRTSVTGPAGLITDTFDLFIQIEGMLLIVTASIVAIILIVVYRSPMLWIVPLVCVGVADQTAAGMIYLLAEYADLTVNGQSAGILRVLVFGAGTDYALLLIARYREELSRHADAHDAMRVAIRRAGPAILASAGTVTLGMLCLLLGELNSHRGLGPVCAIGIVVALVTMMTLLPAAMLLGGRRLFWPFIPEYGQLPPARSLRRLLAARSRRRPAAGSAAAASLSAGALSAGAVSAGSAPVAAQEAGPVPEPASGARLSTAELAEESRTWARIGAGVGRRPRLVWMVTVLALGGLVFGMFAMRDGLRQDEAFRDDVESVRGLRMVAESFPPGASAPTFVIANADRADEVVEAVRAVPGVAAAAESSRAGGLVQFLVVLNHSPDSAESFAAIEQIRDRVHAIEGADALVGGNTAVNLDVRNAAVRDRQVIIPAVLVVVLMILGVLLRAVVAPLLLIATVVGSFFAALGGSALVYRYLFDFPGADPALPLFGFIFLVALGVDYNIFLMTRVREEAERIGHRPGVLHGLAVTGGVITSAGVVLAATFSVLLIFPLVQLAEIGFLVAFGVLLDTLVVRSILVPALALDLGPKVWWPARLARSRPAEPSAVPAGASGASAGPAEPPAGQSEDASVPAAGSR